MNGKILLTAIVLLSVLTGCAVSDDPHQGGLVGYWYGTSSGKYEERQQKKLQQLEEQQRMRQNLIEQAERYKAEFAVQDRKLAQEQEQALQLEIELETLSFKIDTLQETTEKQRNQVATIRSLIVKTRERIDNQKSAIVELDKKGGSASDPNKVLILQHERDRLADEYRKLNVYYQALSNTI